jgi:hypothetical protein
VDDTALNNLGKAMNERRIDDRRLCVRNRADKPELQNKPFPDNV